ncbi:NAD-dependent epimerase/dehydratase family protein [Roseomonas eburnea]|uniref:NAD-dependent epimerase/dehydratase family protein n=1 Tax=Neoroseomonas eburnea TaxID=1346889 RepID=A0A9X9X8C4_9PROT|nr:NAD-dependent epimerase/dehydratase family protein [Neoroseomonas eburnea]MBR0679960.1 NAD-dependent epimerase/dehydratase family protein [Neoroseomonas eburnea]
MTGAAGRIGQVFCGLALRQPGLQLRVLLSPGSPRLPDPIEVVEGDLLQPESCERLLRGQDALVHLAWRGVPLAGSGFGAGLNDGLLPTLSLLDAARRHEGLRIIFPSSGGTVYAERGARRPHREEDPCLPRSPYAIQKLAAEHYIQALCADGGVSARILRISTAYGWRAVPGALQGFIGIALASAVRGEPVRLVGDPANVRDFVHRDDVAEALLLATNRPLAMGQVEVLNIGSCVGTSVREVLAMIERELGRPVATRQEHWDAARSLPGYAVLDISRARQALGWQPRIALREGIRAGLHELLHLAA